MRLQFWKRERSPEHPAPPPPAISRFNVSPRTDIGTAGLPADPETAGKVTSLRRRRELLRNELQTAESATEHENKWQREIQLITQAIDEITAERDALADHKVPAGELLDETPIDDVIVNLEPAPVVRFRIGTESFIYEEPAEWAE
jgi:hypothetical protein